MGDYLRLLTVDDRDVPLAALQRAVPFGAVWSVDHPGMLGNYLAIGPEAEDLHDVWATVELNPVGPNTLGAEEVAEFIDSLETGGPPSAVRWLSDYLETVRAIYAIRIYPEAIRTRPEAIDAVYAVRSALREAGADADAIAPETPLGPFLGRHLRAFCLSPIPPLAPGALPTLSVDLPRGEAPLACFVLGSLLASAASFVGLWLTAIPVFQPLLIISATLFLTSFLALVSVLESHQPTYELGDLRTFKDLARALAAGAGTGSS
ncbi:hypothetical protein HK102_011032 [Quaeritorhiza haematococci]|nr:hypothetical protein HK102_011032 [Quaeritorhiza haematococci]